MQATASGFSVWRGHAVTATGVWTASGVALAVVAPMALPVLLPLCVVAPLTWYWSTARCFSWRRPSEAILVLALATGYLLLNSTRSLSPQAAYQTVAMAAVIAFTLHCTMVLLWEIDATALRAMAVGLIVGLVASGGALCFEVLSAQWAHRLMLSHVPALRSTMQNLRMEGDWVTYLEPFQLNRSISVLVFLLWPALLMAARLGWPRHRWMLLLVAMLPAAVAIFRSVHATSKSAFIGAGAVYGLSWLSLRFTRRMLLAAWCSATLLVAPMAFIAYANELQLAKWLVHSAQHRIVIWGYTSEQIAKAPILGVGIATTRALYDPDNPSIPLVPGTDMQLSTGWHTHNAYLQVWYETGAVGALILLGLGVLVLNAIARTEQSAQPYLYAAFAACALLTGSSFSIWAPWLMAALGTASVFAALGDALPGRRTIADDASLSQSAQRPEA
jgi:O-antigen ligase